MGFNCSLKFHGLGYQKNLIGLKTTSVSAIRRLYLCIPKYSVHVLLSNVCVYFKLADQMRFMLEVSIKNFCDSDNLFENISDFGFCKS